MPASRRRFLGYGLAGVAAAAAAGLGGAELISSGDLPGKGALDALDGACSVAAPDLATRSTPAFRPWPARCPGAPAVIRRW
jgi:hypothetical protein